MWFLLFSLVSAGLTYNMFHPSDRGERRVIFVFFASWLWGELALHAILLQALIAVGFVAAGAASSWHGLLALAITIGSCIALGYGYRESLLAAPAAERALREVYGRQYEEKIHSSHAQRFEREIRWQPILRPFPIRHPDVECVRDIQFAREQGVSLKLDVYRHRSMPDRCPTLLQIHGGAWVLGDKREQALPLMNQLAERGWVCISANYRLSPHATFPDHIIDVKRAIAWIREHGHRYGADPDFIVITGGSAGGHLSALAALTPEDKRYQPGFEDVDTSVNACVPIYGVYDFTDRHGLRSSDGQRKLLEEQVMKGSLEEIPDLYRDASPVDRVTDAAPPFMIVHGDRDVLVPVEEARRFRAVLAEHSKVQPVYVEVPGAQHAFELFPSLRTQGVVDAVERFVAYIYSDYLERKSAAKVDAGSASSQRQASASAGSSAGELAAASPVSTVRAKAASSSASSSVPEAPVTTAALSADPAGAADAADGSLAAKPKAGNAAKASADTKTGKSTKAAKAAKSTKATSDAEGGGAGKATKAAKTSKSTKASQSAKSSKSPKSPKASKAAQSAKSAKSAKSSKSEQAEKPAATTAATKASKAAKAAKTSKSSKTSRTKTTKKKSTRKKA